MRIQTVKEMLVELKGHVDRLHGLLQDPQPGIGTWVRMVGENWKAIAELWHEDRSHAGDHSGAAAEDYWTRKKSELEARDAAAASEGAREP